MLSAIKARLTDCSRPRPARPRVSSATTPVGDVDRYPASYGADQELNDHHFHYGYFIAAAATLAKYDPAWASPSQYGGMVDVLIRDANNYDRNDRRFPFLRDFDIFAGHDWASGHANFFAGNNQESSSEGMNFDAALIQFGQATNNKTIRGRDLPVRHTGRGDRGVLARQHELELPCRLPHNTVGMVWGNGARTRPGSPPSPR
ncbi:glycosyl hydrolase [Kibdelosporangium philippinense]|uniref:glycosyl hydrolase n=1 Tax=Kibdelosporangium philippinense TaxID=211113 RepID=UPI00360BFF80